MFNVKKILKNSLTLLEKALNENNFIRYFHHIDIKARILMFKRLFDKIHDKDLYKVFFAGIYFL